MLCLHEISLRIIGERKPRTDSQRIPDKGAVYGLLSLHGHSSCTLPQLVPPELATAYLPGSGPIVGSALAILTI